MKAIELMLSNDVSLRKALGYSGLSRLNLLLQVFPASRNARSLHGGEGQGGSLQPSNLWNKKNRCHAKTGAECSGRSKESAKNIPRVQLDRTSEEKERDNQIGDKACEGNEAYELWESDITFVWCGVDGWCYLFNALDVFQREWLGYAFDTSL